MSVPSQTQSPSFGASTRGMLRGLLMRRQSTQVPSSPVHQVLPSLESDTGADSVIASAVPGSATDISSPISLDTIYGDQQHDADDEVRFSAELTRLDRPRSPVVPEVPYQVPPRPNPPQPSYNHIGTSHCIPYRLYFISRFTHTYFPASTPLTFNIVFGLHLQFCLLRHIYISQYNSCM